VKLALRSANESEVPFNIDARIHAVSICNGIASGSWWENEMINIAVSASSLCFSRDHACLLKEVFEVDSLPERTY